MKTSTLLLCAAMLALSSTQTKAQMSEYDDNKPVGWATVNGTVTGSNDKNPVQVSNLNELKKVLSGSAEKTIYINGTIEFDGLLEIDGVSNKTIYGLNGSRLVNNNIPEIYTEEENEDKAGEAKNPEVTGILIFKRCKNIIIRNLTFECAGAYDVEGNDNLCFQDCQHMWVDHCDFQDGMDSNFDCNHSSDYIDVTWCRFRYLKEPISGGGGGSDTHTYSNTWGGSASHEDSENHLNTTFYACWWDEGCRDRMPRVRFGKVHVLNCLYTSSVANYGVTAGYMSNLYVEKNVFNIHKPWRFLGDKGYSDYYHITLTGNIGTDDHKEGAGSDDYFIPSDYYALEGMPVDQVEAEVSKYAGATLNVKYGEGVTTGITNIGVSDADIVAKEYYSPSGTRLNGPQRGLNIVRYKMSDGTAKTSKIIVK